jgi:hypothetical protein
MPTFHCSSFDHSLKYTPEVPSLTTLDAPMLYKSMVSTGKTNRTSPRILSLYSDFIVLRSFIKTRKDCPSLLRDDGRFVILSGELAGSDHRFKQHDRNEFHFLAGFATQ